MNILGKKLKFLIIILLLIGIFLRFANLDKKISWADETFTYLRIYGHNKSELMQEVQKSQILSPEYLIQKYQLPVNGKNITDTIKGLALEDPKHPPLYFVLTRFWVDCFGNTVAATRSFSAFISLLVFPCLYWLCWELFQSQTVGLVAIAILSVSPFHIVYAQEARMYSLFTMLILLSSASLLRAMRINTKLNWSVYAVSLSLGFYTHLLFSLVAIGQGIYVAITQAFRLNKTFIYYLYSVLIGLLTFLPWGLKILTQSVQVQKTIEWSSTTISLSNLVDAWQIHLSRIFFDITPEYSFPDKLHNNLWFFMIRAISLLALYSIYFVYKKTQARIWLFIFLLIGLTSLSQAIPDVLFGGIRSIIPRYSIPVYLGLHLCISYLFTQKINFNSHRLISQIWAILLVGLISLELISCYIIFPKTVWSNKAYNSNNIPIVNIINQAKKPLLICSDCGRDWGWGNILSISYLLEPNVKLQLFPGINITTDFNNFSDVFFLNASEKLRNNLKKEQNLNISLLYKKNLSLWKLEKK